jgi:serine/threonine-protein kinase RsbW
MTESAQTYTLVLHSDPKQVVQVEEFLEKLNSSIRLNESQFNKLLVATTEAVNNGIIHGNKRDTAKKVSLTCKVNHRVLTVRVQDEGPGVNPDTIPDPLAEENLLRENGRGVFLMRSLMEEIEFEKFPGGSAVVMKMKLEN